MPKGDMTSLRAAVEALREAHELLVTNVEADPDLEVAGIQKALDNGPAILFESLKGYPEKRFGINFFSHDRRLCYLFDAKDVQELKARIREGFRKPIPPKEVKDAPDRPDMGIRPGGHRPG